MNRKSESGLIQVFIGSLQSIDLLQFQTDFEGEKSVYKDSGIFQSSAQASENATSISLASSGDYLVFKQYDEPLVNVMTICPTNFYYEASDYSCEPCPNLNKTYGI